ncbi:unnamed protein product [Arabidopsis halleri]
MVQSFVVRSVDGNSSETAASLSYTAEVSKPIVEKTSNRIPLWMKLLPIKRLSQSQ